MEAIIGTTVKATTLDSKISQEFVRILNKIYSARTEEELRNWFGRLDFIYFEIGFGGHHMWVKQVGYLNDNKNLIQVNF